MQNTERAELKVALQKKETRIGALEARVTGLLLWKSQQEQGTSERAVELGRLKETIRALQADARERSRADAAGL